MPPAIKKLADKFLSNPKQVEVARPASANLNIEQRLVEVSSRGKKDALIDILRAEGASSVIIFSNRKTTVRDLAQSLSRSGFKAGQIQGDMAQAERIRELDRFKTGEINVLVASDVAARGLDVKGVSHVVNYDVPWHPDDYVHRIGRTGRAGAKGKAFTLVTPEDAEAIANIEKLTATKIERIGKAAPAAKAAPVADDEAPAKPARARRERAKPAAKAEPAATPEQDVAAPKAAPRKAEPRKTSETKSAAPKTAPAKTAKQDDDWNGPVPSFLSFGFDGK
jgi:superfamily II DNA/RNA helicase